MNYCIVAFGIILCIAVVTWIFDGRKHYTGPQLDIAALTRGDIAGMEGVPVDAAPSASQTAGAGDHQKGSNKTLY